MNWYVELTYATGVSEKMYCTSRAEARARRNWYLHNTDRGHPGRIVKAVVRKSA
jgi:hypothetical protein